MTDKPKPPTAPQQDEPQRAYRLTKDFRNKYGAVLKAGTRIDATPSEVAERQIPAEPV